MRRNAKLLTGAAAALLLAAGIGAPIYYFTVYEPAQRERAMRADIDRWGQAWLTMKSCLRGGAGGDLEQALLLHELEAGEDAFDPCREHVEALLEQPDSATGIPGVDGAWRDLETWVKQFDKVFQGTHGGTTAAPTAALGSLAVERSGHTGEPAYEIRYDLPGEQRRKVAEKAGDLDRYYNELRAAAGLAPAPDDLAAGSVAALPAGERIAEVDDLRVIERTGDQIAIRVVRGDHDELILVGADVPRRLPIGSGVVRAPGGDWGLFVDDEEGALRAAELDATGYPVDDGVIVTRDEALTVLQPELAIGTGENRVAVYSTDRGGFLANSDDAGASWHNQWTFPFMWLEQSWVRRVAHAFHDWNGVLIWVPMTSETPGSVRLELRRAPGSDERPVVCFAPRFLWVIAGDEVIRADHDGAQPPERLSWPAPPRRWELGDGYACEDDLLGYAVAEGERARLSVCRVAGGCTGGSFVHDPERPRFFVAFGDAGPLVANVVGDLLVVWQPEAGEDHLVPRAVHTLPSDSTLEGLIASGPSVEVLLFDAANGKLELVPIATTAAP